MNNISLLHYARMFDRRRYRKIAEGLARGELDLRTRIFRDEWLNIIESDELPIQRLSLSGRSLPSHHMIPHKDGLEYLHLRLMPELTLDGGSRSLKELTINSVRNLKIKKLPPALEEFRITWCSVDSLPELPDKLTRLVIEGVSGLKTLPRLPSSLTTISVSQSDIRIDVGNLPTNVQNIHFDKIPKGNTEYWRSVAYIVADPTKEDGRRYMYSFVRGQRSWLCIDDVDYIG